MACINANYCKLAAGYLFPETAKRTRTFSEANPDASILRLGIGDTTEPLTPTIIKGLHDGVNRLGALESYSGYGDSEGIPELRATIAAWYGKFGATVSPNDIWVSDGAKPDSSNIPDGRKPTVRLWRATIQ